MIIADEINQAKVDSHLKFIESFIDFSKQKGWRVVVYGGYGLDGYLQTITRNHGDIDLVIYGQSPRSEALTNISKYLNQMLVGVEVNAKDQDFLIDMKVKSKTIQGNFYYVQTAADPFSNLNIVIKLDGSAVTNSPKDFPSPVPGKLGELAVEVQDQIAHLADIYRKRSESDILTKHDQDIDNIQASLAS